MKITFVMADVFGLSGGDRVIAEYAERLRQRGHQVLAISPYHYDPTFKQQVKLFLKGQGWVRKAHRPISYFERTKVPYKLLERSRPVVDADVPNADVVIATWWETAEWVNQLSAEKGAKAYFIQGYEVFEHLPRHRVEATYHFPFYKITISQWLVDLLRYRYGISQISLVPNSVDTHLFNAPPRGKQTVPTVGLVYSPDRCKGTDISLKAYELAAQQIPNLRLVVFGKEQVPDLPLPNGAEFVVNPPQFLLKYLYAQCDAWLVGSREEGFGLPILEAMACRTPVIARPAGAAPELLAAGGGLRVQSEDPAEMAAAIVEICQMPETQWRELSDRAHTTAHQYRWDDATDLFEAALQHTVERQGRRASVLPQTTELATGGVL